MKHLPAAMATAALTGSLLGLAPQANAAEPCADAAHPVDSFTAVDVALGTRKAKSVDLGVSTLTGCGIDDAVAVLSGPKKTYRVTLRATPDPEGHVVGWAGRVRLDPRDLRNSEAGTWTLRYEVHGEHADQTLTQPAFVRRATRLSFDAGPEPVTDGRLTVRGKLERASWNTHRYAGVRKTVVVRTLDRDDDSVEVDVVTLQTKADGSFRRTVDFPGSGPYWADFEGGEVSAPVGSRPDRVFEG